MRDIREVIINTNSADSQKYIFLSNTVWEKHKIHKKNKIGYTLKPSGSDKKHEKSETTIRR